MEGPRRVASSTPKSSAQHGNLTGPARVLNDVVVSFYNSIQKWNEAYLSSVRVIQNIQSNNEDEDQVQSCCEKLGSLVDEMRFQSNHLQAFCSKLTNLKALNNPKQNIGVSWTFENFVEFAEALSQAYIDETERKEKLATIFKEFSPVSKEFEVVSVAWTQLVSIGPEEELMLKAMTYEANLRS